MNPHAPSSLLAPLHRLFADERRRQAADRDLLRAFAQRDEEDAFAELLRRHGPMVLRLALHLLHHRQDAEDVFQATFLTLARNARSLRNESSLAAWLHRVAWRLAVRSRAAAKRMAVVSELVATHQPADAGRSPRDPADEISLRESQALLHEELAALSERLRLPLILCYLQGRTRDEAAHRLGWSLGTLKRRLEQGRKLLHARLSRRGVTLSAALSTTLLASAEVPTSLARSTLGLAKAWLAGSTTLPASLAVLLAGTSSPLMGKALWGLVLLLGTMAGVGAWLYQGRAEESAAPPVAAKDEALRPSARDGIGDPLPEGAIARLGNTRFRQGGTVERLAFSPDGKTVASSSNGLAVRIWDVKTGRKVRESERYYGVGALAYSPDGATLAVYDADLHKPGIHLLNAATASERQFVALPDVVPFIGGGPGAVAFSPDGKILASVKLTGEICLIDPVRAKVTAVLGKHEHYNVPVLVFSPDGRLLASSAQDKTIRLWDVARQKAMFVLRSEDTIAFPIVFSRDGKWLISGGGRNETPGLLDSAWGNPAIRIWDAATGKQLRVFKDTDVRGAVRSLALAPDGRTLAVSCNDTLRLWDVTTGKVLRSLPGSRTPKRAVSNLCFSPDGKLLAGAIGNLVGLWDVESGRLLNLDAQEPITDIRCVALSGDGRLLATGDGDGVGYLSLWDFHARRLIRRFRAHDSAVRRLAFSPDDKSLASISEYGRLRVWNVSNGRQRYQFPVEAPKDFRSSELVFSPDGKLLAYAYFCGIMQAGPRGIRLLDAATGAERQNFTIGDALHGWFAGIGFSSDGGHLLGVTRDGEIYGWRREADGFVQKGLLQRTFHGSVAITPQGFLLEQVFPETVIAFCDFETGRLRRDAVKWPNLGWILSLSRDGRYLAANPSFRNGGDPKQPPDETLRVYERASGQEVLHWRLSPNTDCRSLAFSPDNRTLIAGMTDSTVLLWDLVPAGKDAAKDVPALWADLADKDAAKAYRANHRLTAVPADALSLLRRRLKPVEGMEQKRIERLIADLDAEEYAVREKATEELRKLGELAEPAYRKTLAARPTLEMRRRLQDLLKDIPPWQPTPEGLRQLRAIEVLERIGTPEARKLLESLAAGAAGARLTREARAAVQRLKARVGRAS